MASEITEQFEVRNRWTNRVHEVLAYDRETGAFTYRVRVAQRAPAGAIAGSVNSEGYRHIRIDGRAYKAHRLAWLIETGSWPTAMIDHINGDRDDNRIANLREATRSQNLANSKVIRAGKLTQKGISQRSKGRWIARIQANGTSQFLGSFASEQNAVAAYVRAAKEEFGAFAKVMK